MQQRRAHAQRQIERAAAKIANQIERHRWLAPGIANRVQRTAECDIIDVMACSLRQRPVLPPAGHAPIDETRIARQAHIRPQPQPLHHAGAKPLLQPVGFLHQAQKCLHRRRVLQVQRQRAARAIADIRRAALRALRSMRTSSAPISASSMAQNGPGPMPASSSIFTPCNGPLPISLSPFRSGCRATFLACGRLCAALFGGAAKHSRFFAFCAPAA